MKRVISIFAMCFMVLLTLANDTSAYSIPSTSDEDSLIIHEENHMIPGKGFISLNDKLDELKELDEGTIIIRFRPESSSIMSLFSLSNNTLSNGHFHLYVTGSEIGIENRYEEPGKTSSNTHVKANVNVKQNEIHTLAVVVDKDEGYKFYLNGKLELHDTDTSRKYVNNIYAPNSARLGETERNGNTYPFNGVIDFAEVYDTPLPEQDLIDITGITSGDNIPAPTPDGMMTDPYSIFYPGLYDSNAYRIPALYHTMDKTLIAGIDKRINHAGDSPANIDIMVRRSFDQGENWDEDGTMINNYPGNASNIDQLLLQDKETKRMYSLVVGFPEGGGFPTAEKGTGFTMIDGNYYMVLSDENEEEYTIRENGIVYDNNNVETDYTVDELRNLYLHDEKVSNILLENSSLQVDITSFLELWHSDDDGESWDGPVDLNPGLKEDWMAFLGVGPGNGIQLTDGDKAGRLVFPVYFTNENRSQASAVIYSDDNGKTWTRGESPNHGRIVNGNTLDEKTFTGNEITESQAVEMPDGQLKLFMRNLSGFAQIATSFDGGETWDSEVVTERDLKAPYSQMTAVRYDGQIDDHEAVIFASAGESDARVNGTVRAGLIKEDGVYSNGRTKYKFDWKYSQLVKEGAYGYSNLTNLNDGDIGLFYENDSTMDFIKFDIDYLKWERDENLPLPNLESISIESNEEDGYYAGDKISIKAAFDDYVMLSGDKQINGIIGDLDVPFTLVEENQAGTEFTFEAVFPKLDAGEYNVVAEFADTLNIYNVYGKELDKSADINKLSTKVTAHVERQANNAADIKDLVEVFEEEGAFESAEDARSLQTHLIAVDRYEKQESATKVVKHMKGFKVLLDHYIDNQLISEQGYNVLISSTDLMLENWE